MSAATSYAAVTHSADTVSVTVNFRQGYAILDPAYMGNDAALQEFANVYHTLDCDSVHINIYGYASPEGPIGLNKSLSQRRAAAIARYLTGELKVDPRDISMEAAGEDWEGLYMAVAADPQVPQRQIVLQIISTGADTASEEDHRKQQLINLDGGRPWRYMYDNIFQRLRGANADVFCTLSAEWPDRRDVASTYRKPDAECLGIVMPAVATYNDLGVRRLPAPRRLKYPWMALRSNLLLPLLNFGVEIPVAEHWSVGADYYYPWAWPAKKNEDCFELTFFSGEVRYWFCPDKGRPLRGRNYLQGHSIGVYGAWGYYDFERNYKGHQGDGWSCGVDYLFSLPVAGDRLRLEFQAAFGAVWSNGAQPYTVYESGGQLIRDIGIQRNFFYFGPTKVAVSLVLPLCRSVKPSIPAVR